MANDDDDDDEWCLSGGGPSAAAAEAANADERVCARVYLYSSSSARRAAATQRGVSDIGRLEVLVAFESLLFPDGPNAIVYNLIVLLYYITIIDGSKNFRFLRFQFNLT